MRCPETGKPVSLLNWYPVDRPPSLGSLIYLMREDGAILLYDSGGFYWSDRNYMYAFEGCSNEFSAKGFFQRYLLSIKKSCWIKEGF